METVDINYDPFEHGEIIFVAGTTPQQKEIWLASQFSEEASLAYNQGIVFELQGSVQEGILNQAITAFCEKFPLTKSSFSPDGDYVCINKEFNIDVAIDDQSALDDQAFQRYLEEVYKKEANTSFDLTFGPLLRAQLLKSSENKNYLLIVSHHIVCDGVSLGIIASEIPLIYRSLLSGDLAENGESGAINGAAIKNLQVDFSSANIQASKDYWAKVYQELPSPYELPSPPGFSRDSRRTFNSQRFRFDLPATEIENLTQLSSQLGCTFPLLTYGIFTALIYRLTNHDDLVIGLPVSTRHLSNSQHQFAHFVNVLPFRHKVDGAKSFTDFIKSLSENIYEGSQYASLSLNELIKHVKVPYDSTRVPLEPITFNTNQSDNAVDFGDISGYYDYVPRAFETFEIAVNFISRKKEAFLLVDFNTSLFSESFIHQLCDSYLALAQSAAKSPAESLSKLSILSTREQENISKLCFGREPAIHIETLHQVFESQAEQSPSAISTVFEGTKLTYEALNLASNQIAHLLINEHNVQQGQLIGICVERSEKMLAVLLGMLKAGAAYLPLDPEYPKDRIAYILEDAQVSLLLTETRVDSVEEYQGDVINIDEVWGQLSEQPDHNPELSVNGTDPCYVIYTSGSTGKPKGVQVAHKNVVNFLQSMANEPGLNEQDKLLAVTTLSFDIAVLELYLPLTVGAQTHIASRDTSMDGETLLSYLAEHEITMLQATPATWRMMLQSGWNGSPNLKGLIGGEALPKELLPDLLPRIKELWNMYGPTETTVWSTCQKIVDPDAPIYIGRPIDNTQVYIVDPNNALLPIEVPGELCIGGEGVTLGYLGKPELTADRFIEFNTANGTERVYKTGDLVRMLATGELEYLNRLDNQVKIRGFRIELGEIEANLSKIDGIDQCVVIAHKFGPSDHRLVAYVKMEEGINLTTTEMRKGLKRELPDYMMPQFFIEIDTVPLTPSGKVDRKSLPSPTADLAGQRERHPPTTKTEIELAEIWAASLKIDQIDVDDFFFDIGGHSLLAAEVVGKIKRKFGIKIVFADLLMISFNQIAAKIDAARGPDKQETVAAITRQANKKEKIPFLKKLFGV